MSIYAKTILLFILIPYSCIAEIFTWQNINTQQIFDNRVACEKIIREFKWERMIWPSQNKMPKPDFEEIIDLDLIANDILLNLNKELFVQTEYPQKINNKILQKKLDNLIIQTKDTKGLRQLFFRLDNNPQTIIECVIKPLLIKDIWNQNEHLKDNFNNKFNTSDSSLKLNRAIVNIGEYTLDLVQINQSNVNKMNTDEEGYWYNFPYVPGLKDSPSAVWTGNQMIIWGGNIWDNTGAIYDPLLDKWEPISTENSLVSDAGSAIWTGEEMIVWSNGQGSKYNPQTDTWTFISEINAPNLSDHTAIWTGEEMIVWGYQLGNSNGPGGRYNPATDTWTQLSTENAPDGENRKDHSAVWTGTEMIIFGGMIPSQTNTGGRYNPVTDTWLPTSTHNTPNSLFSNGVSKHKAVWTGEEMIVFGGTAERGGIYNPITDTWIKMSEPPIDIGYNSSMVWTGVEAIIWGGQSNGCDHPVYGYKYFQDTDSWQQISSENSPLPRINHAAVWTGAEMIVWGGRTVCIGGLSTGGRYNPSTDVWTPTKVIENNYSSAKSIWTGNELITWPFGSKYDPLLNSWDIINLDNRPLIETDSTKLVWTGTEILVWGSDEYSSIGAKFNPMNNSWSSLSNINSPSGRTKYTFTWSGDHAIVWGGIYFNNYLNSGGKYDPDTDLWTDISEVNAPEGRINHESFWTSNGLLIWGGRGPSTYNSGAIYNPVDDEWISIASAPTSLTDHQAVFTGSKMIAWGYNPTNKGLIYDITSNIWDFTSNINVPSRRTNFSAVWTGEDMLVWGGAVDVFNGQYVNSGSKYNLENDHWSTMSNLNAPEPRSEHDAFWTNFGMLIYGGRPTAHGVQIYNPDILNDIIFSDSFEQIE